MIFQNHNKQQNLKSKQKKKKSIFDIFSDPPGQAFISKDTELVVKGQAITLTCSVDEPGRPEATQFIWQRGGHVVNYVNSFNWTIDPVTLETEANISCVAVNEVGQGRPDFINIQVIGKKTPLCTRLR